VEDGGASEEDIRKQQPADEEWVKAYDIWCRVQLNADRLPHGNRSGRAGPRVRPLFDKFDAGASRCFRFPIR